MFNQTNGRGTIERNNGEKVCLRINLVSKYIIKKKHHGHISKAQLSLTMDKPTPVFSKITNITNIILEHR